MLAALVLVALVLAAGLSTRRRGTGAAVLALVSVLWLVVNRPMEGPVLYVLAQNHGLTGGDLAGLAGLALAAYRLVRAKRERRRPAVTRAPR